MKNRFIEQVTAQIQNKTARTQIEQELESHILDKIDYYVEIGYSYEEAEQRATDEMGSSDDTALPLNGLHKMGLRQEILSFAWIILINIALFISFIWLGVKFNYQSYIYTIFHSIGIDFLSLAFAATFLFTLIMAQKRHSRLLADCVSCEILLICIVSLLKGGTGSLFSLFAPMFYSIVTIISQGFSGYIDCIFGYGYIPDNLKPVLAVLSAVLMIIFVVWSLLVYLSIYRKERMWSTKKITKSINITKSVISIFIAVNFVVMAFSTAMAVVGLPEKIEATKLERSMMMETVINWDISKSQEELISYLYGLGYKSYHGEDNQAYANQKELYLSNSNNMLIVSDGGDGDYQIAYVTTTQDNTQPLIVQDDMTIGFKETSWMESGKINLQKFLEFDWSDKSFMVTHDRLFGDTIAFQFVSEDETIIYYFYYEGDEQTEFNNRSWEDYILGDISHSMSGSGDILSDSGNEENNENYDDSNSEHHSQNLKKFMEEIIKEKNN